MATNRAKKVAQHFLELAGITINGSSPWDMQVHNEKLYSRVLSQPIVGLGESYMDGWWDSKQLDLFFQRIIAANLEQRIWQDYRVLAANSFLILRMLRNKIFNQQSKKKALDVGLQHYDIGNDLYQVMLDPELNYTCGYWKDAKDLASAQIAKLELCCQKLKLQPGMKILDIGCGWGAFAKYAANHYGVSVVGITISKQQQLLGQDRCAGLPIEIRFQDYREVNEHFDRICSLGMFEHVGEKNYKLYMKTVHRCLADDGLFLLHTIGNNYTTGYCNAWINKYIFPHGMLPSIVQIGKASERLFVMEDWHNFGADYDKTLMAWQDNFEQHWPILKANYSERFHRMWNYYLLSCAAGFRQREMQLWQVVFSKKGVVGGYQSAR
jgi:cyclopropane-fatty-acyl-phospholipid synthase